MPQKKKNAFKKIRTITVLSRLCPSDAKSTASGSQTCELWQRILQCCRSCSSSSSSSGSSKTSGTGAGDGGSSADDKRLTTSTSSAGPVWAEAFRSFTTLCTRFRKLFTCMAGSILNTPELGTVVESIQTRIDIIPTQTSANCARKKKRTDRLI